MPTFIKGYVLRLKNEKPGTPRTVNLTGARLDKALFGTKYARYWLSSGIPKGAFLFTDPYEVERYRQSMTHPELYRVSVLKGELQVPNELPFFIDPGIVDPKDDNMPCPTVQQLIEANGAEQSPDDVWMCHRDGHLYLYPGGKLHLRKRHGQLTVPHCAICGLWPIDDEGNPVWPEGIPQPEDEP